MTGAVSAVSATAAAAGITASGAATAASIGSAIIGGVGAIESGNAQASAAKYQSQVAANNAQIATQNASFAGQEGEANEAAAQAKTRAQVGGIIASQAANGIDVNNGSASSTQASAAQLGELNTLTIRSAAARQAYGYQTQAASDTAQSALDKQEASYDQDTGYLKAGTTVLGGLGGAYSHYLGSTDPTGGLTQSPAPVSFEP